MKISKKYYVLLELDMSFAISGIEEHTNGILFISEDKKEVERYAKTLNKELDTEIHLYHDNYEAFVIQEVIIEEAEHDE